MRRALTVIHRLTEPKGTRHDVPSPSAPPAAPPAGRRRPGPALPAAQAAEQALRVTHYNPGAAAIFPVSSTLVTGEREAILIDAHGKSQAAKVVDMIRASGRS